MQHQILINIIIFVAYVLNLPLNTQRSHSRSQRAGKWSLILAHDRRPIYRAPTYIAVPLLGPHQPRYIGLTLYLNQCWFIITKVRWHSSEGNFISHVPKPSITKISLKITYRYLRTRRTYSNLSGAIDLLIQDIGNKSAIWKIMHENHCIHHIQILETCLQINRIVHMLSAQGQTSHQC